MFTVHFIRVGVRGSRGYAYGKYNGTDTVGQIGHTDQTVTDGVLQSPSVARSIAGLTSAVPLFFSVLSPSHVILALLYRCVLSTFVLINIPECVDSVRPFHILRTFRPYL